MEPSPPLSIEARVEAASLEDTVDRARVLTYALSVAFTLYGFSSLNIIQRFEPTVTLWENIWPRFVFNSLPFLLFTWVLRSRQISAKLKISLWITTFSAVFQAAAWIHVWPIALRGQGSVLTFVHSANIYNLAVIFAGVAPPVSLIPYFAAIYSFLFALPLFIVCYLSGDRAVFSFVTNDTAIAFAFAIVLNRMVERLRSRLHRVEIERELEASKFLGPVLSRAIFAEEKKRLARVRCRGFIISIDIRDSTDLLQELGTFWLDFRAEYFAIVSQEVSRYGGYVQKTVGDCHIVNFGVMDYDDDLSGVPGIEHELARAEERRLQRASDGAFGFVEALFIAFEALARRHFPNRAVHLAAGIDKGWVERGVQGDAAHSLELDVNGDPVNCSNRLQEYTKAVRKNLGWESSMVVVSPFASDYLRDATPYAKIDALRSPVRNYPGIRWVLVRRFTAADERLSGKPEAA